MNYKESINFITSKDNFYIDLGLERIKEALFKLNSPQKNVKIIHVSGTNGKGSVCAMLDSILRKAGYKIGLYTSPHIWEYTERIRINGIKIPEERFANYAEKTLNTKIHLTEFEILTVIMFLYFNDENVDYAIIETGLGGRLDATNVTDTNLCSIITHIDFDHTERLGNTLEEIAAEKAGIIKNGCPVVTNMKYNSILQKAENENSKIIEPQEPDDIYKTALSLKGVHQFENLALVIEVIKQFFKCISVETISEGLKNVIHPCRFQYFPKKNLIIDASHNPNGIQALRNNLDVYYPNQKRRFIFGCLRNKNYKLMTEILFKEDDDIYLSEFDYPNACSYEELKNVIKFPVSRYIPPYNFSNDKLNIICGSFYMIGQMKELNSLF